MKSWKLSAVALVVALVAGPARSAEPEIVVEAMIFKLQDKALQDLKLSDLVKGEGKCLSLDSKARTELCEKLNSHSDASLHAAPKLSIQNDQTGRWKVGQQYPILEGTTLSETTGVTNIVRYEEIGIQCKITPTRSADLKTIRLKCEYSETTPSPTLVRLTSGMAVTAFDSITMQSTFALLDGQSILVSVGKPIKRDVKTRHKLPILADYCLFGELLTWDETTSEMEYTLLLLTAKSEPAPKPVMPAASAPPMLSSAFPAHLPPAPLPMATAPVREGDYSPVPRVMPVAAVAPAAVANPKNAVVLQVLLEQYDAACKAGDLAKAGNIALFCLEMDPACFAKR